MVEFLRVFSTISLALINATLKKLLVERAARSGIYLYQQAAPDWGNDIMQFGNDLHIKKTS